MFDALVADSVVPDGNSRGSAVICIENTYLLLIATQPAKRLASQPLVSTHLLLAITPFRRPEGEEMRFFRRVCSFQLSLPLGQAQRKRAGLV